MNYPFNCFSYKINMNLQELSDFYLWVDNRMQDSIEDIPDTVFNQKEGEGRSLRQLIEHFITSYDYLTYDGDFKQRGIELQKMSRDELLDVWKTAALAFTDKLPSLTKAVYKMPLHDKVIDLDRDEYVFTYTDHLTYHRGQIATKIRELGYTPENTDYYTYIELKSTQEENS